MSSRLVRTLKTEQQEAILGDGLATIYQGELFRPFKKFAVSAFVLAHFLEAKREWLAKEYLDRSA